MKDERDVSLDEIRACPKCRAHGVSSPGLRGAAASVGIEHGLTTAQTLFYYFVSYHVGGHVVPTD